MPTAAHDSPRRRERLTAAALLACLALVGFWLAMSQRSRRPFEPFDISGADLESFRPAVAGWRLTPLRISPDPQEPNVIAFAALPDEPLPGMAGQPFVARLVHGYNMPDCMRQKEYTVRLLADTREALIPGAAETPTPRHPDTPTLPHPHTPSLPHPDTPLAPGLQVWRLEQAGRVSFWITSMLQTGDFGATAVDTRSMAYPRIGTPDNPGWFPRGLTWRSLRHPVRNLRLFLRAKWNAAHCDVLAFLNLRRAAGPSDQLLTLAACTPEGLAPDTEAAARARLVELHQAFQLQLQQWRIAHP